MLAYEDKVLQRVLRQFDGMTKIEVFDILHQIEILLQGQVSPIQFDLIKMAQEKLFLKNAVLPIGNRGYCYLVDYCQYIKIYEFKTSMSINILSKKLYYNTLDRKELIPLTNQNIKTTFKSTHLKYVIHQFLKDNNVKKKNTKTNRLLLLELLDQID